MNEADFIQKLQKRATEQERIIHSSPFPKLFLLISIWLGKHPWRIIIPISILFTMILRIINGKDYTDFILSIFKNL